MCSEMNVYNLIVVVMHLSRWYDMAKRVFFYVYLFELAGTFKVNLTCRWDLYMFVTECSCLYVCFSQWLHSFRAETLASGCTMAGKHEQHLHANAIISSLWSSGVPLFLVRSIFSWTLHRLCWCSHCKAMWCNISCFIETVHATPILQ